jgi:DNA-binding LytR/AlgR family response regulator
MNVLIAEDEGLAAERLVSMIQKYDASISILDQVDTVSQVKQAIVSGKKIDLLFLDIQLADGKSFEVFDSASTDIPIVFTTAYDQYALKAFQHHSIDYLLKPIQQEDLTRPLDKYNRLNSKTHIDPQTLQSLRELMEHKIPSYKQRIVVKAGNKITFKQAADAAYFYADGKEAYLVTQKENRKHLVAYTLEELEEMLHPNDFFRISRKYIVRADAIAEVKGTMTTRLEIKLNQPCQHDLTVSRERTADFKKWLDR